MTYSMYLLQIDIRCKHYKELYSEMRYIVGAYLKNELNGVDLSDDIFGSEHSLVFNSLTEKISFVCRTKINIDEKTHHKLMLLNSDYQYSNSFLSWRIFRIGDNNIALAIEEVEE